MIPAVVATPTTTKARDGWPLACTTFSPKAREPERVVIVACAMGIRRGFYEPYARFLAANGCTAITFDYRGIGGSRTRPLREVAATMRDWAERDLAAVIDAAGTNDVKVQIVGHSIGGQFTGLLDNHERVGAICTVAAQHGYWRLYPPRDAVRLGLLWHVVVPGLSRGLGHFPGKRFGFSEDLPKGVALEWARWARHPDYMVDRKGRPLRCGFSSYRGPIRAYSFADDDRAPERCVRALHELFASAAVEYRHVEPVGGKSIGHVGFFRSTFKRTLWRESLDWLRAQA